MAKTLRTNVFVYDDETAGTGEWYGPDYGNADKAPADKISNPAAWEDPADVGNGDFRFRADDFGVESGKQPNLREQAELEAPGSVETVEAQPARSRQSQRGK
jgi:hypothetical protein